MTDPKRPKPNSKTRSRSSIFIGAAIALIILLTVVLILFVMFVDPGADSDTPAVVLPSPISSGDASQENNGDNDDSLREVAVTVDTVQSVVSTLSRADSYVRTVRVDRFSTAGSGSSTMNVWVRGASTRIEATSGDVVRNILLTDGELWIWYSDSDAYYHGPAADGHAEADAYQSLLSYEELLTLPKDAILDAGYYEFAGESCIYADYTVGELGYRNIVYISVSTGLLMGCETYDGNTLVYRMISAPPDISTPSDEVFAPPA